MIDSHCHLAAKEFDADLANVIARAHDAGIDRMITIADTIAEGMKCIGIAEANKNIFATIGVHPHHAKDWIKDAAGKMRDIIRSSNKLVAIGEMGLDYHYNLSEPGIQKSVFREQLMLAKELGMPCVVHCREAVKDVWAIVSEVNPPPIVLHCCSESIADVEPFLSRGDLLSFTGIATYASAQVIRDTITAAPITQIMVETDAPYLAPIPHRGKRNEPAFVMEVAKVIAKLKGLTLEDVDRETTRNAVEFFRLPSDS